MTQRKAKRRGNETAQTGTGLWLLAAALILAVLGAGVWLWAGQNAQPGPATTGDTTRSGPRLALNTERIDLGRQPFDKSVRAEFKVQNTGDQPLKLDASTPIRVVEGC